MAVDCSELEKTISALALNVAERPGVRDLDGVVKALSDDGFTHFTRDQVADAIVAASASRARDVDELTKKRAVLRGEARRRSPTAQRTRLEQQIGELEGRLKAGPEYVPPKKSEPLSKELDRLEFERDKLRREINTRVDDLKPKTIFQKAQEPFNFARTALQTAWDTSAVFRQGAFIGLGNPARAARAIPSMLRAFVSEQAAYKAMKEIDARPNSPLYARSKLHLSELDGPLNKMEESLMSKWAVKLPVLRGSGRSFNVFLNRLRADTFDALAHSLGKNSEVTLDEAKAISNYINKATGRGSLGSWEQAAVPLAQIFFAPRYVVSRFQLLAGQPFYGGNARTRKLIALEYAKYLTGLGVVYAIGGAAGGTVEHDPRSSDFGKLVFDGRTRLDPLAGLSQTIVPLTRVIRGESKDPTTGVVSPIRGDVPYNGQTTGEVIGKYFRSKLSPMAGAATDIATGEMFDKTPTTAGKVAANLTIPMSFRDIYEAFDKQNVPKSSALSLLTLMGMGLNRFEQKKVTPAERQIKQAEKDRDVAAAKRSRERRELQASAR